MRIPDKYTYNFLNLEVFTDIFLRDKLNLSDGNIEEITKYICDAINQSINCERARWLAEIHKDEHSNV